MTPGSELVKVMKEKLKGIKGPEGGETKVVEQGGATILSGVQKRDPFRKPACRWLEDCMVNHGKTDCMETGCIYKISCNRCSEVVKESKEMYLGQSGRSLHARQQEHAQGLTNSKITCPLVRHNRDTHTGVQLTLKDFTMDKVMSTKDNMTRMIGEGQTISDAEEGGCKLWNSKGEFGKSKLIRWTQQVENV